MSQLAHRLTLFVFSLCFLGAICSVGFALGEERYVQFDTTAAGFPLVTSSSLAPLVVDAHDFAGVHRAARALQSDVERVSGRKPVLTLASNAEPGTPVLIGTVGRSPLIDSLIASGKFDVSDLRGRWEASVVQLVANPFPGVPQALVVAGSDKRGTIFGIYRLSEQIGVSPWYWWADVPVQRRDHVVVRAGRHASGEPVVKYRGIFLNDEAPALSGWAEEKFGGFNSAFYAHVFELILRLRGNYLWPAMWGNAFNDDDPANPALADEFGIVMGTSHHEPLMRAHDEWRRYGNGPWNYQQNDATLRTFWKGGVERVKGFEKIISIGMRGDGDEAMSEETNVALLERIVGDQRKILEEVLGRPASEVPQLWALYKEVQSYYENGMRVPDDVTLLWCDDNWGNIRRLPTPAERKRPGGAGVYYHFDYVGGPRNYKWINTVPISKVWEQMHLAWQYEANRIWIVNVGDLKPMEFPIEFFLTYAWNPARWPYEKLEEYSESWATREFGPEHARRIARLINGYTKLNGRRKPEMLAPDTLSLVNYRESERVLGEWRELVKDAEELASLLPAEAQDAFFQLVLYPVKASAQVQELYVAAGLNRLYARQGRVSANAEAERVRALFAADGELARRYHTRRGGKWNHQMAQIKFGYTYWQQPDIETMPAVHDVRARAGAAMAVAIEGSEVAWPSYGAKPAVLPGLEEAGATSRWIEIFNRGAEAFPFTAKADQRWVRLTRSAGTVKDQVRLEVSVDWAQAPGGRTQAQIEISGPPRNSVRVTLPVRKGDGAPPRDFVGFVETDGFVAIEAPHFQRAHSSGDLHWKVLSGFGRTSGGVTVFPVTSAAQMPDSKSPHLEYDVWFTSSGKMSVELQCAPSLDFQSGDGLRLAVSIDDSPPRVVKLGTWENLQTWGKAVADGVRSVVTEHSISQPGRHVLKVWYVTPGVVVQRVVIDAGGVRPSYFGPPESTRVGERP